MTPNKPDIYNALPYAISAGIIPCLIIGAVNGGAWLWLVPVYGWYLLPLLDILLGQNDTSIDPETSEDVFFWHRFLTVIWAPIQFALVYGTIWYATHTDHLTFGELIGLFVGVGVISGSIGIVFAHELMHQRHRVDRWMSEALLAMTLYSHFRSEHMIVHHTHVGTPRDLVTARYNEGFWKHFVRVVPGCFRSALHAEADRLEKKGLSPWDISNPFWRYFAIQYAALFLAGIIGGLLGMALFFVQAIIAIFQLELINYIEHYGLQRQKDASGKYEPVKPRHSWNATHRASGWYLLNVQRHSDHHYKPARPYPLLQSYGPEEAPMLPASYPVMTLAAAVPPIFRRIMNPRVRAWRRLHYPEITDWKKRNKV